MRKIGDSIRRLVIIEPVLLNSTGHFQEYSFSIANEAIKQGFEVDVWCPCNYSGATPAFLKPILPEYYLAKDDILSRIRRTTVISRAIAHALSKEKFSKSDVIFFPSVFPADLLSLTLASTWHRPKARIICAIRRDLRALLQYVLSYTNVFIGIPALLFFQMCGLYLNRILGVSFASDTDYGAKELAKIGMKNAFALPIPHLAAQCKFRKKKGFVVGYLGDARFEKGFDLLPKIISELLKKNNEITFIVQSNFQKSPYATDAVLRGIRELEELQKRFPSRIKLVHGTLSREKYLGIMEKCSVILLPYRRKFYGEGGSSGILAEAIPYGGWIVVPSGTWMAAQKEKYGKIIEFGTETPESIISAIDKCLENDNEVEDKKIMQQIKAWGGYHSAKNFIKTLFEETVPK